MQHEDGACHPARHLMARDVSKFRERLSQHVHEPELYLAKGYDARLRREHVGLDGAGQLSGHALLLPSVREQEHALAELPQPQSRYCPALQPSIQQAEGLLEAHVLFVLISNGNHVETQDGLCAVYLLAEPPAKQRVAVGDHGARAVVLAPDELSRRLAERGEVLQPAVQGAALGVGEAAAHRPLPVEGDGQGAASWCGCS
mmetsp:Transcript_15506/g.48733  ORF Transcript_15506/g.48733 Transcript_15506/m.48733 type:complete len:201 (-) Transcript_15506:368-970(-)